MITACLLSIVLGWGSLALQDITVFSNMETYDSWCRGYGGGMDDIRAQVNVLAYISEFLVPDLLVMSSKTDLGQGNISTAPPNESTATT